MSKNSIQFDLDYAIKTKDGRELSALDLHRLNVAQLQSAQAISDSTERSIQMLADSAHLSVEDIRLLDVADYSAASDVVATFLQRNVKSPKTS